MNNKTLLSVAAIGLVAYFVYRSTKSTNKMFNSNGFKSVDGLDKGTVSNTTASLLAEGLVPQRTQLLMVEDIKVPVREPLFIKPTNSIPNVYDRGVGSAPAGYTTNTSEFYDFLGTANYSMKYCKNCKSAQPKLDIPSFL